MHESSHNPLVDTADNPILSTPQPKNNYITFHTRSQPEFQMFLSVPESLPNRIKLQYLPKLPLSTIKHLDHSTRIRSTFSTPENNNKHTIIQTYIEDFKNSLPGFLRFRIRHAHTSCTWTKMLFDCKVTPALGHSVRGSTRGVN